MPLNWESARIEKGSAFYGFLFNVGVCYWSYYNTQPQKRWTLIPYSLKQLVQNETEWATGDDARPTHLTAHAII